MIALISTLVVVNIDTVLESGDDVPIEELLPMAVKEARYMATIEKDTVYLRFNPDNGRFEILNSDGLIVSYIQTDHVGEDNPAQVTFYAILPDRGRPFGRPDLNDVLLEEIPRVTFSALLVSTPFVTGIEYGDYRTAFRFDPFSNVNFPFDPNAI